MAQQLLIPGNHSNAQINQMRECDRAAHRWYRFVLSYPPHLVQTYIERFGLEPGQCLLDPFSGTGTTIVEGKKHGIKSLGVEANPLAQLAGNTKCDWGISPNHLMKLAFRIAEQATNAIAKEPLQVLPSDAQRLLIKDSISPMPLHKALALGGCIEAIAPYEYRNHLRLAFARAAVECGNLRFGPEVGVGKIKQDAPVIETWLALVGEIAEDIVTLSSMGIASGHGIVVGGDARNPGLNAYRCDAVITSPPYPNEKDYTRTTRLESVLLGFINNRAELRQLKQGLLRSNTRNIYKGDTDDAWVANHPEIQRIAQEIENRRIELGKTSGFERLYPQAVKQYFGGMARHLAGLKSALRPGAQLAYVVSDQKSYLQVMIRTGELLADIAQSLGYEVVGIDLFRTHLATATQEQMREEVVLLKWNPTN